MKFNRARYLQNSLLLLFGILLGLLLVELLMRAAGFTYSFLQEKENLSALRKERKQTILCVGESTTVMENYPRRMEEILNRWAGEEIFSVVNRGVVSITTQRILARIEDDLENYRPDIVVVMMGINDPAHDRVIIDGPVSEGEPVPLGDRWKTLKLIRALIENIRTPREKASGGGEPARRTRDADESPPLPITSEEAIRCWENDLFERGTSVCEALLAENPADPELRYLAARFYREIGRGEEAERILLDLIREATYPPLEKREMLLDYARTLYDRRVPEAWEAYREAVVLEPEATEAYREIADFCCHNDLEDEFLEFFLPLPLSPQALTRLSEVLIWQKTSEPGIRICRRALETDPGNRPVVLRLAFFLNMAGGDETVPDLCGDGLEPTAGAEIGWHHYLLGNEPEARRYLESAAAGDPGLVDSYLELGRYYAERGWTEQAEKIFQRALLAAPSDLRAYARVVETQLARGKNEAAEQTARTALSRFPDNDKAPGLLGTVLEMTGRTAEAAEYYLRAEELRGERAKRMTVVNYRRLHSLLRERGIPLVAVQYPMRSLDPLRWILAGREGVTLVDNEANFREAVAREGYETYFTDFFAGDFGHFTPAGARLLAENVARALVEAGLATGEKTGD